MTQLVICGLGGQGILFLTKVIAQAAMRDGSEVLVAETHGMAQRGGAVVSCVKMGPYEGSLVRQGRADAALALDAGRLEAARAFLRPGGACFVNAPAPLDDALSCDASGIARELGTPRVTNLVLLGFATREKAEFFPNPDAILAALDRLSPLPARAANRQAFEGGAGGA